MSIHTKGDDKNDFFGNRSSCTIRSEEQNAIYTPGHAPWAKAHRSASPTWGHCWTAQAWTCSRLRQVPVPSSLYTVSNVTKINAYNQATEQADRG